MKKQEYDVLGIGNAIVDVLTEINDSFIEKHNLKKGMMEIIDAQKADQLYKEMQNPKEVCGGSVANTIAALSALGGSFAFVGKTQSDILGASFKNDINKLGIYYDTKPSMDGPPTARCFIFITPDAERTMQTFLGACVNLAPDDIDPLIVSKSKITYLEGYLWDSILAREAFLKAAKIAKKTKRKIALSLSDPFCVNRHRKSFAKFIQNHVDILFANEEEIKALFLVKKFETALSKVRGICDIVALTRGKSGSVIINNNQTFTVKDQTVNNVVDTTGAGDAYAAGFLSGITKQRPLNVCGQIGGIVAGEIISHFGARSESNLKTLVAKRLNVAKYN